MQRPKKISEEEQATYKAKYPHIAPEIVKGKWGESILSDIFSFALMASEVARKCEFELHIGFKQCVEAKKPSDRLTLKELIKVLWISLIVAYDICNII